MTLGLSVFLNDTSCVISMKFVEMTDASTLKTAITQKTTTPEETTLPSITPSPPVETTAGIAGL